MKCLAKRLMQKKLGVLDWWSAKFDKHKSLHKNSGQIEIDFITHVFLALTGTGKSGLEIKNIGWSECSGQNVQGRITELKTARLRHVHGGRVLHTIVFIRKY